jgi:hypothetical protein
MEHDARNFSVWEAHALRGKQVPQEPVYTYFLPHNLWTNLTNRSVQPLVVLCCFYQGKQVGDQALS